MTNKPPSPPAAGPPPAARTGQLAVELPADLEAVYANTAIITHSPSELVLDFARLLPNVPKAKIYARVIMTPMNAKLLHRALGEHLAKFEGQYGEIHLPEGFSLADHLFRPPPKPSA